ncbi:hypothetical protein CASFOL_010091 [Castilleja foliolosa]|uniref:Uncharacterized protein n=1 Tax=Castilleja foliolosa TaxID=1961234 RepID=A0ABD3DT30_9LAMI
MTSSNRVILLATFCLLAVFIFSLGKRWLRNITVSPKPEAHAKRIETVLSGAKVERRPSACLEVVNAKLVVHIVHPDILPGWRARHNKTMKGTLINK